MKTISYNNTSEIIINKSKFICKLIKVYNEDEAINAIKNIKNSYKDATHYCYSYIINNTKRFSDDGEPCGTAGFPILNVLESNNLNNVLAVVIRYFGGIKLGANGLIRAYTKSVSECLNNTTIKNIVNGYKLEIVFDYEKVKFIDNLLKDIDIRSKNYNENVTYIFYINNNLYEKIKKILTLNCIKVSTQKNILLEE